MKRPLGLFITILSMTVARGAMPTYRTMALETDKGEFIEFYFDRVAQTNGQMTLWAQKGDEIAKKYVIDAKNMRYRVGDEPFKDIAPGTILERACGIGPQLKILNAIKPPVFRAAQSRGENASIYNEDFKWDGPKYAMYLESKDAKGAVVWALTWDESDQALTHTLMRAECLFKTKQYRFTHMVTTTYDKPNNRDVITRVAEVQRGWVPFVEGTRLWTAVYGEK